MEHAKDVVRAGRAFVRDYHVGPGVCAWLQHSHRCRYVEQAKGDSAFVAPELAFRRHAFRGRERCLDGGNTSGQCRNELPVILALDWNDLAVVWAVVDHETVPGPTRQGRDLVYGSQQPGQRVQRVNGHVY